MLKLLAPALLFATLPAMSAAQTLAKVHTPDVDLAYLAFGAPTSALPVIAVNGGPGLSHVYMVQNDLWQRASRHRSSSSTTGAAPAAPDQSHLNPSSPFNP